MLVSNTLALFFSLASLAAAETKYQEAFQMVYSGNDQCNDFSELLYKGEDGKCFGISATFMKLEYLHEGCEGKLYLPISRLIQR
jgi:hypothetical protein